MTYYPLIPAGPVLNPGGAEMLTLDQLQRKNVDASYVGGKNWFTESAILTGNLCFQPPIKSIKMEDVLKVIDADIIIMKIDIEGYECKVCISITIKNIYKIENSNCIHSCLCENFL